MAGELTLRVGFGEHALEIRDSIGFGARAIVCVIGDHEGHPPSEA
ncbi:MAG: hypothetical protein ACT4OQ_08980 [Chloroflexota bacterium]